MTYAKTIRKEIWVRLSWQLGLVLFQIEKEARRVRLEP